MYAFVALFFSFSAPSTSVGFSCSDYIFDQDPATNRFISVPKEMGQLNCAAFIGGIIRGILDSADFTCTVVTHLIVEAQAKPRTVYAVKFEADVIARERR